VNRYVTNVVVRDSPRGNTVGELGTAKAANTSPPVPCTSVCLSTASARSSALACAYRSKPSGSRCTTAVRASSGNPKCCTAVTCAAMAGSSDPMTPDRPLPPEADSEGRKLSAAHTAAPTVASSSHRPRTASAA